MVKPSILDPVASYSFSQYGTLPFDTADILAEFGVAFQSASLQLPEQQPLDPAPLTHELVENLALVDPTERNCSSRIANFSSAENRMQIYPVASQD